MRETRGHNLGTLPWLKTLTN